MSELAEAVERIRRVQAGESVRSVYPFVEDDDRDFTRVNIAITVDRQKLADAYLSTLTAPTPVDWQPIETAPKVDMKDILVCRQHSPTYWVYGISWWQQSYERFSGGEWTHWRPLPDPPTLSRPKPQ